MNLPDSRMVTPGDLLSKLTGADRRSRSRLAKAQDVILSEFTDGEFPLLIAVDSFLPCVAVITSKKVFLVWGRRLHASATPDRISRTRLGQLPSNAYVAFIDGPGISVQFETYEEANRFTETIDRYLLSPAAGPRDLPLLYPDFYLGILHGTGKPASAGNVVAIIDRVTRMISGSAAGYFEQSGDDATHSRFTATFTSNGDDLDFQLRKPDLMIDFLWEWDPRCHDPLRQLVPRIGELLTGPDSFLRTCGEQIPPWE